MSCALMTMSKLSRRERDDRRLSVPVAPIDALPRITGVAIRLAQHRRASSRDGVVSRGFDDAEHGAGPARTTPEGDTKTIVRDRITFRRVPDSGRAAHRQGRAPSVIGTGGCSATLLRLAAHVVLTRAG